MGKIKNNLPGWDKFCAFAKLEESKSESQLEAAGKLGFKSNIGDITRMNARYRLARELKYIEFESYSKRTTLGYDALLRAFLACTAYERYICLVIGESGTVKMINNAESILGKTEIKTLSKLISSHNKAKVIFEYIEAEADRVFLKNELNKYLDGKDYNPIALLIGLRHIFAHGNLTPNANQAYPQTVTKIANLLSEFVLDGIAADFDKRVLSIEERPNNVSPEGE